SSRAVGSAWGDASEPVRAAVLGGFGVEDEGRPGVVATRGREAEAAGHASSHGPRAALEPDLAVHDRPVPAEAALPEIPGEEDRRRLARLLLLGAEDPAQRRLDAEHREERGRDRLAADPLGLASFAPPVVV